MEHVAKKGEVAEGEVAEVAKRQTKQEKIQIYNNYTS